MDLPDDLLSKIALCLVDCKSLRATCRRGRAAANWAVTRMMVRQVRMFCQCMCCCICI